MKILQVLAGAEFGGAETAFVDTCIAMVQAGAQIEVVTRPHKDRIQKLQNAGIKTHCLPFGGVLDVYTPYRLRRVIQSFQPEIVQTWMSRAALKTPRWLPSMGIPPYLIVSRLGGYYKLKYFKSADYFTTITPDIRRYLIRGGVDENKVCHINNFAETDDGNFSLTKSDLGIDPAFPLILALGRLHTSKAFDVLIKAAASLKNVSVCIAGEGPERNNLESLIKEFKIEDRIKLLGWRSDRSALFSIADLCVFPSRYEPFGTVFVQAWAHKVPLVTTNSDGPCQFVRNQLDALLVPVDDIELLAQAISRLLGDASLCRNLAERGYVRYMEEFTKSRTIQSYFDFFREIREREKLSNTRI